MSTHNYFPGSLEIASSPLLEFLKDSDRETYDEIIAIKTDHVSIELAVEMLQTDAVRQKIAEFKATSNSFLDELSRYGLYIVDVHSRRERRYLGLVLTLCICFSMYASVVFQIRPY